MKDALKRAGLDPKEHWEHQPKDKLARIYWVVSLRRQLWSTYCAELTWKVKECQPYMARFAHNWLIEEYIKCSQKNVRAYLKKLDDGTNATLLDINSEEFSDVQGERASDCDMRIDDIDDKEMFWQWMEIYFCHFMFSITSNEM